MNTLADIYLNKRLIAKTENMHRTYKFDVRKNLLFGTNEIHIVFHSPKKYIQSKADLSRLPSILGNTVGNINTYYAGMRVGFSLRYN